MFVSIHQLQHYNVSFPILPPPPSHDTKQKTLPNCSNPPAENKLSLRTTPPTVVYPTCPTLDMQEPPVQLRLSSLSRTNHAHPLSAITNCNPSPTPLPNLSSSLCNANHMYRGPLMSFFVISTCKDRRHRRCDLESCLHDGGRDMHACM